jgi:hypothetical protein
MSLRVFRLFRPSTYTESSERRNSGRASKFFCQGWCPLQPFVQPKHNCKIIEIIRLRYSEFSVRRWLPGNLTGENDSDEILTQALIFGQAIGAFM